MNKRDTIKQKINSLSQELKKLEEQEKQKVGEFMLDLYQKKDLNLDKIRVGIAKILGDDVTLDSKVAGSESALVINNNSSNRDETSTTRFENNRN